jgi:hypothetical protein
MRWGRGEEGGDRETAEVGEEDGKGSEKIRRSILLEMQPLSY